MGYSVYFGCNVTGKIFMGTLTEIQIIWEIYYSALNLEKSAYTNFVVKAKPKTFVLWVLLFQKCILDHVNGCCCDKLVVFCFPWKFVKNLLCYQDYLQQQIALITIKITGFYLEILQQ